MDRRKQHPQTAVPQWFGGQRQAQSHEKEEIDDDLHAPQPICTANLASRGIVVALCDHAAPLASAAVVHALSLCGADAQQDCEA